MWGLTKVFFFCRELPDIAFSKFNVVWAVGCGLSAGALGCSYLLATFEDLILVALEVRPEDLLVGVFVAELLLCAHAVAQDTDGKQCSVDSSTCGLGGAENLVLELFESLG